MEPSAVLALRWGVKTQHLVRGVQDASGLRGASCLVAAGDEAALHAVPYQLGYASRDIGVDFQVNHLLSAPGRQCSQRLQDEQASQLDRRSRGSGNTHLG